jgi:UDP-glucuronate 4-epimerase
VRKQPIARCHHLLGHQGKAGFIRRPRVAQAQAGVRHSIDHPEAYVHSNLQGFANVLELGRDADVRHLVYASSSSVYGSNAKLPFSETDSVDHPNSLYAATKKSNELMAHAYSHVHGLPTTGLRFFTVYGPWGRPDMAYFRFAEAIMQGKPIEVFNHGNMQRDFTEVDDVVDGVLRVLDKPPPSEDGQPPWRVFNVGNNQPVGLSEFIDTLERCLGRRAERVGRPMQAGDVVATWAHVDAMREWVGWQPRTTLANGLSRFARWHREVWLKEAMAERAGFEPAGGY